jgi:hypothetical protein
LFVDQEVELRARVGRAFHDAAQGGAPFSRRLEVELVVAGERDHLALKVERVLAEHLLKGKLAPPDPTGFADARRTPARSTRSILGGVEH